MIVGVYDYDFMNYSHAVPNLECAKYCTYLKRHNNMAILTPKLSIDKYTKFIIRKDYDDKKYNELFFKENVSYGGHAFSGKRYIPLDISIESVQPNFEIYKKYFDKFGCTKTDNKIFMMLLHAHHFRISLDNKTIWKDFTKQFQLNNDRHVLFLHDKNLSEIEGVQDILLDLTTQNQINLLPRSIGTKFPIIVKNDAEFEKWFNISPQFFTFFLQYEGLINNETLIELVHKNKKIIKSFYYAPLNDSVSEDDFYKYRLPILYKQILFLRNYSMKTSIVCDELDPNISKTTKNLIYFLNSFIKCPANDQYSLRSLFTYARSYRKQSYWKHKLTIEEIREVFQKVREKNYEVFDMFYQWDRVKFQGGKFINDTK